ncbi:GGDEF domain-containing protein [Microbaculum marinum]|uniref:diguanylate cyclase n=1 Tax=Microbaculum marinum TaxID=1764581 RepID=A0AAW9RS29_9HYPH
MSRSEQFERSVSLGEAALGRVKAPPARPYPRSYEFWYVYAAGFNRELNKAVNDAIKRLGHLPEELTERFREEFLSPVRLSDRVGEVSSRVSKELDDIITLLEASGTELESFGQSLRSTADGLGGVQSLAQLRTVVDTVQKATRDMGDRSATLELQLKASRTQIAELQESLEAIRYESLTDQLTGLANRKHFDHSLDSAIDFATRRSEKLSLVMCDIDHFKDFNDRYGHQTGDQVLRLVGAAIGGAVKPRDLAARYGGEEFCVILPSTSLQGAVAVANQIRAALMAKELIKRSTGESLGRITMSAGVAELNASDTHDSLVERADMALYASKRLGRNRVTSEDELPDVQAGRSAVA